MKSKFVWLVGLAALVFLWSRKASAATSAVPTGGIANALPSASRTMATPAQAATTAKSNSGMDTLANILAALKASLSRGQKQAGVSTGSSKGGNQSNSTPAVVKDNTGLPYDPGSDVTSRELGNGGFEGWPDLGDNQQGWIQNDSSGVELYDPSLDVVGEGMNSDGGLPYGPGFDGVSLPGETITGPDGGILGSLESSDLSDPWGFGGFDGGLNSLSLENG